MRSDILNYLRGELRCRCEQPSNQFGMGVYDHIAGDGREYVFSDVSSVKIRAEDGRSISQTDISMFINNLPNKMNTKCFSTQNASGSTSQAANVVEAVETGCRVLLIDEDTSATNFMIRDQLMQEVISAGEAEGLISGYWVLTTWPRWRSGLWFRARKRW